MKRTVPIFLIAAALALPMTDRAHAAKVRVRRGPAGRVQVTVRPGFPIRRALPAVVVRPGAAVHVAPRTYLAPVAFGAVVVASLPADNHQVWRETEVLERKDGWTEFTMNVDRRGDRLLLKIDRGAAQISFAEVAFDNGDTQVIDFNDQMHRSGLYSLLDFEDGRKVDHVRVVAKSDTPRSEITLHLTT